MAKSGILLPFRLGPGGNPVTGTGKDLRASKVQLTFGTTATGPKFAGELPYDTEFGSRMEELRQRNVDTVFRPLAAVYGLDALGYAMPYERVVGDPKMIEDERGRIELRFLTKDRRDKSKTPTYAEATTQVK